MRRTPGSSTPTPSTFVARSPVDLVALVPMVLGFHPADSVVLLTFGPPGGSFHARVDLPVSSAAQEDVADVLARAVSTNNPDRAAVLLYSDDEQVCAAMADRLVNRLLDLGCEVIEVLRVDDGCWVRLPEDGSGATPYDLQTHPFTAQLVFDGRVVHRDRAELADTLVGTDEDDATAVALAATRFADLLLRSGRDPDVLCVEAHWVRRRVRRRLADHQPVDVADAARLLVLVSLVPTRDVAWAQITRRDAAAHVELWRELVRRAPRDLVPGAASLLAFAAWQAGDGALAWCGLDRALEVDPDYSMAHLLGEFLVRAVPPDTWQPMADADLPVLAGAAEPRRPGAASRDTREARP
jgi:uncharacterized protein DUF4192